MSEVYFFKSEISEHKDERRNIFDVVLPKEMDFPIVQIKRIEFPRKDIIIGNHKHTKESGRIEVYIAVGPEKQELFKFFYRDENNEIKEKILFNGEACVIPPERTHTFIVLAKNSELWGLSNLRVYDPKGDVKDILVE